MAQPLLGLAATALVIVVSIGYLALFDFAAFVGWVSFFMLCLIPAQIVLVVMSPNPPFAARLRQPQRGAMLILATVAGAIVAAPLVLNIVGEAVRPPGPIPSQFAVIVVPTTFFLAIMFGGWPFTKLASGPGTAALMALAAAYVLTLALFHLFFNYDFMQGAPVYLASAPSGLFHGVTALVFYVTALAGMFLILHFDLWPFTKVPALMRQPVLGVVWLLASIAVAVLVMAVTGGRMDKDPMWVLTRVTAPFIFGTIVVLNMLQGAIVARLAQPLKGAASALAAAIIGVALGQLYGWIADTAFGPLPMGAPGYEYELWLVNALLSVTFPFLIFYAAYFDYWPLTKRAAAPTPVAHT